MQAYVNSILDIRGNVIAGAVVAVYADPTGAGVYDAGLSLSTLYSDNGVTGMDNPFFTDANGQLKFFSSYGHHVVRVTHPNFNGGVPVDTPITLSDLAEILASEAISAAAAVAAAEAIATVTGIAAAAAGSAIAAANSAAAAAVSADQVQTFITIGGYTLVISPTMPADLPTDGSTFWLSAESIAPLAPTIAPKENQACLYSAGIPSLVFNINDLHNVASCDLSFTSSNTVLLPVPELGFTRTGSGQTRDVTIPPLTGPGSVTLGVTVINGDGLTGYIDFLIQAGSQLFTVTTSAGANGTITATNAAAVEGGDYTVTATPAAGYGVNTLTVDGVPMVGLTFYTFSDISDNHTVSVTFQLDVAPEVTAFVLPATNYGLTVPVTTFTATDDHEVTGYWLGTSATEPALNDAGWNATPQTQVVAAGYGSLQVWARAKDASGNISAAVSDTVSVEFLNTMDSLSGLTQTVGTWSIANVGGNNKAKSQTGASSVLLVPLPVTVPRPCRVAGKITRSNTIQQVRFGAYADYDQNGYFMLMTNAGVIYLSKKVAGATTHLLNKAFTFSAGVEYTVELEMTATHVNLYVNGVLEHTVDDTSVNNFTKIMCYTEISASNYAYFDDIALTV